MKTTRHSLMAKGIMVLLSLIVLIFAATYAWFGAQSEVDASGITASLRAGVNFEVAIGFATSDTGYNYLVSDFSDSATLTSLPVTTGNETETYDLLANYSPKDVTGDGTHLYIPLLHENSQTGRREVVANTTSYTEVTPNREYISFDMLFKCERACNVYIDNGSYIKAGCETTAGDGSLTTDVAADNKSDKGNFSKDAVVGAMRVAFVNYNFMDINNIFLDINDDDHLKSEAEFIWLPRKDVYLDDSTSPNWTLHTAQNYSGGETAFYQAYGDETIEHKYYDVDEANEVTYAKTVNNCNSNTVVPVNIPHTYTPEGASESVTDYYLGKCRVNIWVEGMDAEARRAIAGGRFFINFDLRAG